MTNDERDFYKSQVKLAEAQEKSLENQDKILKEQVKILKEQTQFTKILMFATIILALSGLSQVIYYFEFFSQNMIKDSNDSFGLILIGLILIIGTVLVLNLMPNFRLRNKKK